MADFHFSAPKDGCTPESFGFLSTMCISNALQFYTSASYMGIFLVLVFVIGGLLTRQLLRAGKWTLSSTVLLLASLIILGLFFQQLGNFFGASGVLRMFLIGMPFSILVTGVTLVFTQWFLVISSTSFGPKHFAIRHLWMSFYIFNGIFQVLYWGFWLAAGGFADRKTHNVLGGVAMFVLGLFAVVIGASVMFLGQKLGGLLTTAVESQPSPGETAKKIKRSAVKIVKYSIFQSFLWLSGGISAMGVGIWAFASGENGVTGFYYLANFAWAPMTSMVAGLLVYAAMMMSRPKGNTGHSSIKEVEQRESCDPQGSLTERRVRDIIGVLGKEESRGRDTDRDEVIEQSV